MCYFLRRYVACAARRIYINAMVIDGNDELERYNLN